MIVGVLAAALTLAGLSAPPSLEAARSDELEALRTERDGLRKAVDDAASGAKAAIRSAEAEVEQLTRELAGVQLDNAARERSLPASERTRAGATQQRQLAELQQQQAGWLELHQAAPVAGEADDPERLPRLFEAVLHHADRTARARVESDATWFDTDGSARHGAVLRVGQLAAVAWDDAAQPLVDTPQGLQAAAGVTGARIDGSDGVRVQVVLQDPDVATDPRAWLAPDWRQTMDRGGPLMWVLLGFGVLAALVAIERLLAVGWIALRWRAAVRRLEAAVSLPAAQRDAALAAERDPIAAPLVVVLAPAAHAERSAIEELATQAVIGIRERLYRRLSLLSLAAAVAPLAGLLGTVNGMITTFSVVTSKGTSDAQQLAGGISEALLTTQFGLAVAIPALVVHALLVRGARRVLVAIEQAVLQHIHGIAGGHEHHHGHEHGTFADAVAPRDGAEDT